MTGVPKSNVVSINGLRLHYVDWGTEGRPPLICLHGYTSHSRIWDLFAQSARDQYHVLGLDQRGHGESGWATDGYARDLFVDDLSGFIDALDLSNVTLVGLSMGGWHALLYAAAHRDVVEKVILVDIGPEVARQQSRPRTAEEPTPSVFDSLEDAVRFARRRNPKPPDDLLRLDITHSLRQREDGKWVWRPDPAMLSQPLKDPRDAGIIERYWKALESLTCPVLLVRGRESGLVPDKVVDRMKKANPGLSLVDVEDSGHNVPVDSPQGFLDATREFLGLE